MRRLTKRALAVGAGVMAIVGIARAYERYETPVGTYATWAAAERAGEVYRGWLPEFVPRSATELHLAHNVDSNRHWLRFTLPTGQWRALTHGLAPLSLTQVWQDDPAAPGWIDWWHPDLRPARFVPTRGQLAPVLAFRGPVPNYCLAVDTLASYAYVWTC